MWEILEFKVDGEKYESAHLLRNKNLHLMVKDPLGEMSTSTEVNGYKHNFSCTEYTYIHKKKYVELVRNL